MTGSLRGKAFPMNTLLTSWLRWLDVIATWQMFALLLAVFLVCVAVFASRARLMNGALTPDGQMLKLSYDDLIGMLHRMGEQNRRFYALTQCTLDIAFPIIYAQLLGITMRLGFGGSAAWLTLLPLVAAIADVIENYTVAWVAWRYRDGRRPRLAWCTLVAGKTKYLLIMASTLIALAALAVAAWRGMSNFKAG